MTSNCCLCLDLLIENSRCVQLNEKINDTQSIKNAIKYQFIDFEVIKKHPVDFLIY